MFKYVASIVLLILFASSIFSQTVFVGEFKSAKIFVTDQMKKDVSIVKNWSSDTVYVTPTYTKAFIGNHKSVVNPLYGAERGKNVVAELNKYNKIVVLRREEVHTKRGFWIESGLLTQTKLAVNYVTKEEFDSKFQQNKQEQQQQFNFQRQLFQDSLRTRDLRDSVYEADRLHFNGFVGVSGLIVINNSNNSGYGVAIGSIFSYSNWRTVLSVTVGGSLTNNKMWQGGFIFRGAQEYLLRENFYGHVELAVISHKDSETFRGIQQIGFGLGISTQFSNIEVIPTVGWMWGLSANREIREYNVSQLRFAPGLTLGYRL